VTCLRQRACYEISMTSATIADLARTRELGALLSVVSERYVTYDLLAHWKQGEFHHDVVVQLPELSLRDLPGRVLVVATNCNGGVKEVLCLRRCPTGGRSGIIDVPTSLTSPETWRPFSRARRPSTGSTRASCSAPMPAASSCRTIDACSEAAAGKPSTVASRPKPVAADAEPLAA
jgi:hypothetical protein